MKTPLGIPDSIESLRTMADSIPQPAWFGGADSYLLVLDQQWYYGQARTLVQLLRWGWPTVGDPPRLAVN